MADLLQVADTTFQHEVLESPLPVIVDFTAAWCSPCKMLDPVLKQLSDEWQGKVKFLKLDVDDNPEITMRFQVLGVPTLMLFQGGEVIERTSGYLPKERLVKTFGVHL